MPERLDSLLNRVVVLLGQLLFRQGGQDPTSSEIDRIELLQTHIEEFSQRRRVCSESVQFIEDLAFFLRNNVRG